MKKGVCILLITLLTGSLFASGNKEDVQPKADIPFASRTVTLQLVMEGNAEQQEWMQDLKKDFTKEYPNITIDDIWLPMGEGGWGAYFTKIKTMVASGNSPDVVRVAVEGFQVLHEQNLALPLNPYIKDHPEYVENYADIHPRLQEACVIDGNIYGFGWDWNNIVTHINLDMLKDAGLSFPSEDWGKDEFLRYAKALTRERDGQMTYGVFIPNSYFQIEAWLYNYGASVLSEDMKKGALTTDEAIMAFTFMHDLVYRYKVAPVPAPGDQFIPYMTNRQVAMTFGGRWPVPSYVDAGLNFDVQYVPTFKKNEVIFGVGMFPVLTSSKYPEEAYVLSSWLSGRHSQKTYLNSFSIPSRISVMDEVLPGNPPENSKLFRLSADTARVVQSPSKYPEVQLVVDRMFNNMMSNPKADIKAILTSANKELNEVLSR